MNAFSKMTLDEATATRDAAAARISELQAEAAAKAADKRAKAAALLAEADALAPVAAPKRGRPVGWRKAAATAPADATAGETENPAGDATEGTTKGE